MLALDGLKTYYLYIIVLIICSHCLRNSNFHLWLSTLGVDELRFMGQILPITCFCEYSFTET